MEGPGPEDASDGDAAPARPIVSVVMANWQGERHLAAAIRSVLGQSLEALELLIADDASGDGSAEVAAEAMARDARVRWLPTDRNAGPSDARNRALDAARGDWIAVVDSDDLMHPRRLEILVDAAGRLGVDMIADDLAHFGEGAGTGGRTLLGPLELAAPLEVGPALFVESEDPARGLPSLGYLKPLIRREAMHGLRYDPALRVGEDFDLCLRLLLGGARMVVLPMPMYLYRRHATSLSHRLSVAALEPLLAAHRAVAAAAMHGDPALATALAHRGRSLERALRYERLVAAIKARAPGRAARLLARDPSMLRLLIASLREGMARRGAQGASGSADSPARVALVTDGAALPPGIDPEAARDGLLVAPSAWGDRPHLAPALRIMVCAFTEIASRRPVALTVIGLDALESSSLLPPPASMEVWLTEADEAVLPGPLPERARLRRLA